MTITDFISLAVSAFGLGLIAGLMFGSVIFIMRSLGQS